MSIKVFLEYVEIRTKLASLFPFVFGVFYSLYVYGEINLVNTILMYLSLLSLDMGVTAINNFMDFKKSKLDEYKYNMNVIGQNNVSEKLALGIILCLLGSCTFFGILLVINTSLIVLFIGVIAVLIGISYTYGFAPISRMPLGEVVSGFTMGFFIVYLSVYIQNVEIAKVMIENSRFILDVDLVSSIKILFVSLPFIFIIANLMLGNNMRDVDVDIKNERFLLPYYLGQKNSLLLFKSLYFLAILDIVICSLVGILPIGCVAIVVVIRNVSKNIENYKFYLNHENVKMRSKCFKYAVGNMVLISVGYLTVLAINLAIKIIL